MINYIAYLEAAGKPTADAIGRIGAHVLPVLGDVPVAELTSAQIREWLADLARSPAMIRSPADGRRNVRHHDPDDAEVVRARRNSANKVLSMLKAGLNHAFDEGLIGDNAAWGRRVKPFNASAARKRYLTLAEARRLLEGCAPDLRALVRAGLETGARLSEPTAYEGRLQSGERYRPRPPFQERARAPYHIDDRRRHFLRFGDWGRVRPRGREAMG
jgi:hypothetical protein